MSETVLSISQPNGDAEEVAAKTQNDVEDSTSSEGSAETDDDSHRVNWTVYIALAIPQGEDTDAPEASKTTIKAEKASSAVVLKTHKADSCYIIQCNLLPGDAEAAKMDLVVFGPVAKLHRGHETKILKTWHEGDKRWIGWAQSFNVRVDKDMLGSLLPHKIRIQIWNSSEELSSQARHKKLKAFWVPQDESEDAADVYGGVEKMVKRMRSICEKKPCTCGNHGSDTGKKLSSQLITDAGGEDCPKTGTAWVEISPVCFLAGETSLTGSFPVCSAGVFEVMCDISLDGPLLSEQLKVELNPMVITLLSATSMPSSPVPFHVLQEKCMPVYCQYKFHNQKVHRTNSHQHGAKIPFRDVNVILTGLMSPEELQDFLCGPPMEIQVHDRDLKLNESLKPGAGFGTRLVDDTRYGSASFKETAAVHLYGAAFLNLSELLCARSIKISLPIKSYRPPSWLDRKQRKMAAGRGFMPQGHFYEANSQLKVKVDIVCPLSVRCNSCERPFGRIVYLIGRNNSAVVTKLKSEILKINAAAFQLGSRSLENIETALSNYIMNFKHDESKDLDFVTGFHVLDKTTHIVVVEGLKHKAVKKLWETITVKLSENEDERVMVRYNSGLGFFKRIYESLHVSFSPIHLNEPLQSIMRKPLIYIKGAIPQLCFQALSRLSQLCNTRHLEEAQSNLFPSADMILSLMKYYGLYQEPWKQTATANTEEDAQPVRTKTRALLNTFNTEYVRWKRTHQQKIQHDFLQRNIEKVREESEQLQKTEASMFRMHQAADAPVHNYSIQTLNSKVLAKKQLQTEMAKVPGRRWTYSQRYLGATVDPGDEASASRSRSDSRGWESAFSSTKINPKHPGKARVEELRKPWRENVLHANILQPTLPRDAWRGDRCSEDFQLYKKPDTFFSAAPVSFDLAGDARQQEELQAARDQFERWRRKLLPDGWNSSPAPTGHIPQFKCHMRGNSDQTQGLLKDEPKKYSLRKRGLMLKPLPQLAVMDLGNRTAEEKMRAALAPGPCTDCRLGSKHNAIPRLPSPPGKHPHMSFAKQNSFLYERSALPLNDEETTTFTFQSMYHTHTQNTHKTHKHTQTAAFQEYLILKS